MSTIDSLMSEIDDYPSKLLQTKKELLLKSLTKETLLLGGPTFPVGMWAKIRNGFSKYHMYAPFLSVKLPNTLHFTTVPLNHLNRKDNILAASAPLSGKTKELFVKEAERKKTEKFFVQGDYVIFASPEQLVLTEYVLLFHLYKERGARQKQNSYFINSLHYIEFMVNAGLAIYKDTKDLKYICFRAQPSEAKLTEAIAKDPIWTTVQFTGKDVELSDVARLNQRVSASLECKARYEEPIEKVEKAWYARKQANNLANPKPEKTDSEVMMNVIWT